MTRCAPAMSGTADAGPAGVSRPPGVPGVSTTPPIVTLACFPSVNKCHIAARLSPNGSGTGHLSSPDGTTNPHDYLTSSYFEAAAFTQAWQHGQA
ncbi:hypothetical protein FRAHR75_70108 [Frankia sp. Hr75.2]|nr:hypothetical protein FRAHR75_70108 [Frankia sp. Hr75.2]